jgi:hypothetical protein
LLSVDHAGHLAAAHAGGCSNAADLAVRGQAAVFQGVLCGFDKGALDRLQDGFAGQTVGHGQAGQGQGQGVGHAEHIGRSRDAGGGGALGHGGARNWNGCILHDCANCAFADFLQGPALAAHHFRAGITVWAT